MNVLITGGTGFVGQHLTCLLTDQNHHVYILTRTPDSQPSTASVTYLGYRNAVQQLPTIHAVVNLAGESLFGYWSKSKKEAIRSSRVQTTRAVLDLIRQMERKPSVWVNGSAIGYYGMSGDLIFTEDTVTPGNDFLATVVTEWEKTASQAKEMGIRTVYARFGVVLGEKGALPLMRLPAKAFAGGPIGSGEQWISWIHVEDAAYLLLFCIQNEHITGPINVTAPNPKRNKEFTRALADTLNRPYWFPAPAPLVRIVIGEMSQLVTSGQYVLPKKAESYGYSFHFPEISDALKQANRQI